MPPAHHKINGISTKTSKPHISGRSVAKYSMTSKSTRGGSMGMSMPCAQRDARYVLCTLSEPTLSSADRGTNESNQTAIIMLFAVSYPSLSSCMLLVQHVCGCPAHDTLIMICRASAHAASLARTNRSGRARVHGRRARILNLVHVNRGFKPKPGDVRIITFLVTTRLQ